MLVKHNICPFYNFTDKEPRLYKSGKCEIKDGMIEAESLTDDNFGVIKDFETGISKDKDYTISFIGILESGKGVLVRDQAGTTFAKINDLSSRQYSLVYKAISDRLAFECYVTDFTRFNLISIIVNEGKKPSEVYLPNITTLSKDKQALLPPEGEYKEIQPQ